MALEIEEVKLLLPDGANVILAQAHFIKTVEDVCEAIVNTVPDAKFGIGFSEASGARLIRYEGNDTELIDAAVENIKRISAGHSLVILLRNAYPINILTRLKDVPEVVNIFCATANPVRVVVARSGDGGAILGVIDGSAPVGVEGEADRKWRHDFLRRIGYKF
ncbi:adenosine-specific kinase [bacterium]|nr:adenosine-specific kinase [bacterium]